MIAPNPRAKADVVFSASLADLSEPPGYGAERASLPAALLARLLDLQNLLVTHEQRSVALDRIYREAIAQAESVIPLLDKVALPIPQATRSLIRNIQKVLSTTAKELLLPFSDEKKPPREITRSLPQLLWKSVNVLSHHLLISSLIASPPTPGIWKSLHGAYDLAVRFGHTHARLHNGTHTLENLYFCALLIGCAHPTSLSSKEVALVAAYARLSCPLIDLHLADLEPANGTALFWIDPEKDAPAVAWVRRRPPPQTRVRAFSCERLGIQLKHHLGALVAALPARLLDLPEIYDTLTGRSVLQRLLAYWTQPGKRNFPRRRQSYRVELCAGLERLWRLYRHESRNAGQTSTWMITNESPDGYAIMHVSGATEEIVVGDVVALRTESGKTWQICIVRWALSENQEHLELGLQMLSTEATAAMLPPSVPGYRGTRRQQQALFLPGNKALMTADKLLAPSGTLQSSSGKIVLYIENESIEAREVESTGIEQQNERVELLSLAPRANKAAA